MGSRGSSHSGVPGVPAMTAIPKKESCVCAVEGKLSTYISCGGTFEQNTCRKIPFVYMCTYIFTGTELSGRSFSLCLWGKGKGFSFYFKSFST